jgi:putative tricarboxylic transport membrane protein
MNAKVEHGVAAFCILLGSMMLLMVKNFPKFQMGNEGFTGPGFFPVIIGVLLLAAGVGEIFEARKSDRFINFLISNKAGFINICAVISGVLLYILTLNILGFIIATFIFSFGVMLLLKVRVVRGLSLSFFLVILLVLIFGKLFHLPLPAGTLIPWEFL